MVSPLELLLPRVSKYALVYKQIIPAEVHLCNRPGSIQYFVEENLTFKNILCATLLHTSLNYRE